MSRSGKSEILSLNNVFGDERPFLSNPETTIKLDIHRQYVDSWLFIHQLLWQSKPVHLYLRSRPTVLRSYRGLKRTFSNQLLDLPVKPHNGFVREWTLQRNTESSKYTHEWRFEPRLRHEFDTKPSTLHRNLWRHSNCSPHLSEKRLTPCDQYRIKKPPFPPPSKTVFSKP